MRENLFRRFTFKDVLIMLAVAVVYFTAGKLGLKLAFVNASATAVWPPTGIAIASLLILGLRFWPAIFIAAFLVNITTAGSLPSTIGIAIGNTLEGLVGAYLVSKFANGRETFNSPPNIFRFALLAGVLSTMVSATIGVSSLVLNGLAQLSEFGSVWITWWLGDLGGALIVAPLLIILSNNISISWNFKKTIETFFLFFLLVFVSSMIFFSQEKAVSITSHPYLIFPILMWIGFRLGQKATIIATFLLAAIATFATLNLLGPFTGPIQNDSLLLLQIFMGVTTISALILSSAILEREIAQNELNLRQKEKAEFLALAAHQLRTPLATLRWNIETLLETPLNSPVKKKLDSMYSSNLRMIHLVKDLLSIQRMDADKVGSKPEKINPLVVIAEVYKEYGTFAQKKDVALNPVNKVGKIPLITFNIHEFKEIMVNLISNAIKYNKPGGSVDITITAKSRFITMDIIDTGVGIPPKEQGKIFSQFYRTENALIKDPQGTGLGLYLVKFFVERRKGKVWFESKENLGTTFHLEIPQS